MISAGSGPVPRTALNAASCNANERVPLKNRNGFSTCQSRSCAVAEFAKMPVKTLTKTAAVASALRRMTLPSAAPTERHDTELVERRGAKVHDPGTKLQKFDGKKIMSLNSLNKISTVGRRARLAGLVALAAFALTGCISSTAPILGDAKAILGDHIDLHVFAPRPGSAP